MIFHSYVTVYQRVIPRFFKDDAVFGSFCLTIRFWKILLGSDVAIVWGGVPGVRFRVSPDGPVKEIQQGYKYL